MKFIGASAIFRKLMWRLGRKMYTYARGEGENAPRTNGEYWLLDHVLKASSGPQVLLDVVGAIHKELSGDCSTLCAILALKRGTQPTAFQRIALGRAGRIATQEILDAESNT